MGVCFAVSVHPMQVWVLLVSCWSTNWKAELFHMCHWTDGHLLEQIRQQGSGRDGGIMGAGSEQNWVWEGE